MTIHIDPGHHWLIIGETGAGKTFWAQNWLLPRFRRQIVVDTEELEFDDRIWKPVSIPTAVRLAKSEKAFRVRIPMDVGDAGQQQYEELSRGLLDKGHDLLLFTDEYADFTEGNYAEQENLRLTRKSRKRGITLARATQRPQAIDKTAYTQARHHVWFGLDPADIEYWHLKAPYLQALAPKVPIGSFRWIYHHSADYPNGQVFEPAVKYRWRTER